MDDLNFEVYEFIICPITHQIFFDPVIAMDGHTYERSAIKKWFKRKSVSPSTGKIIKDNLVSNFFARNIVDMALKQNKELIKLQYIPSITDIINGKRYIKLFKKKKFKISHLRLLVKINNCKDSEVLMHVLDNMDLEYKNKANWKPVHFICRYSTPEIIQYMMAKKVDIKSKTTCESTIFDLMKYNSNLK